MRTCHRRGAFAMGGMAALIPSRTDPEANDRAIAAVRADKEREAGLGFDGTWVAHPDVVGVARRPSTPCSATSPTRSTGSATTSGERRPTCSTRAPRPGRVTEAGLRGDVSVGFQYLSFWLGGRGAAGIDNLMEDAATAEISRSQIWQWIHHGAGSRTARPSPRARRAVLDEEMARIRAEVGDEVWQQGRPEETRRALRARRALRRLPGVPHAARV